MVGRLKGYLARRRSPRIILSAILFLTGVAGFSASVILLKTGLVAMWLRYPLAVLFGWGVFLLLVSLWAKREREEIRVEEELANLGPKDECFDAESTVGVFDGVKPRLRWLDWLDIPDVEGCLVVLVVMALMIALAGAIAAIVGLIMQAEVVLAEALLDALLISALSKRLHKLRPQWWLEGTMRQTIAPMLCAIVLLMAGGYLLQDYAPEASSIGAVWRHWRGPR